MIDELVFNEAGLLPAIAQDAKTGQILMVAWMNAEAFEEPVATRQAVYFSRSRQRLWRKGEESGHVQHVKEIRLDCDGDVLLLSVEQVGGIACHTGRAHCFYKELSNEGRWEASEPVIKSPESIYSK
jgi:phosphoribosyl-AMP cyclohydrolase